MRSPAGFACEVCAAGTLYFLAAGYMGKVTSCLSIPPYAAEGSTRQGQQGTSRFMNAHQIDRSMGIARQKR